ncbi:hypothetical protein ACFRJ1_38855 [Streptomyces sp. NPDC056773]|uniref:hypothetical protein n=1 Tax=unclassified Streptomyces TaxID=2593676 RepID=UPI0036A29883
MTEEDRAGLKEVLARCPQLDKAARHVRDFGEILTDRLGPTPASHPASPVSHFTCSGTSTP